MEPENVREISERDQLWASLRALRPEIDRLAGGGFDDSPRQRDVVILIARIVAAELNYRARDGSPD
jgi:hypothetical protein